MVVVVADSISYPDKRNELLTGVVVGAAGEEDQNQTAKQTFSQENNET